MRDRRRPSHPQIAEDSPEGAHARREMGEAILRSQASVYLTDGTALGNIYDPSPMCWPDGSPLPPHSIMEYRPTTRPGARAPHAWLPDGRSTLDFFGHGFVLMRFGDDAPDASALAAAFARRGVPLAVVPIAGSAHLRALRAPPGAGAARRPCGLARRRDAGRSARRGRSRARRAAQSLASSDWRAASFR